ncbi:carnitine acetyl transferase [Mycena latifolia]|nr:carnitine acetyl transferase [Mycena latifolia]
MLVRLLGGSRRLSHILQPRVFMSTRMSVSQPADWKLAAPEPPPGTQTFGAQSTLPLLPVPELETTLTRLKDSLKPLAWSDAEVTAVEAKIAEFGSGLGPELQQRLLERSKQRKHWLEEWWDNTAYLGYRDSVVVNVSYYYGFDSQPVHQLQTPTMRAAYLARATLLFRQQYKLGRLPPEATKDGPLCMDTYRWMFDCCRVPGPEGLDWSLSYAVPGDTGDTGHHIIVFRNNRVWKVPTARNGRILSVYEINTQLRHICENSEGEYPGVGVLAASNRDVWAQDYTELASSPHNAAILQAIQSAAFTISLDSSLPLTPEQHSRTLWHGDVSNGVPIGLQNRWVDKPVQYIVFENGTSGLMGEHSVMDGTPTVRLADDVLRAIASPAFDKGRYDGQEPDPFVMPTPLDWKLSPTTAKAIEAANGAARELIEGQELGFHLTSYGKGEIKRFGVSPDSWAQMIVQLAYRRLLGGAKRMGGTYEAASTRRFFKGRTEAIRVVSAESDAWAASMDDPAVDQKEKKKLFNAAVKTHGTLARAAGMGQGVDRHLFGLKKLVKEGEKMPALFTDPLFLRSSNWVLSTSAVFSKHFPVYGWGEVVPDGFGVAYMTGFEDRLQYTITSRKESPNAQFCAEIARAAEDLYALHSKLDSDSAGKPKL